MCQVNKFYGVFADSIVSISTIFLLDGRYTITLLADLKKRSVSPLLTRWLRVLFESFDLSAMVKMLGCSLGSSTVLLILLTSACVSIFARFSAKYLYAKNPPAAPDSISMIVSIDTIRNFGRFGFFAESLFIF